MAKKYDHEVVLRPGQQFRLGDDIVVAFLKSDRNNRHRCTIGVDAPAHVPVNRAEAAHRRPRP